MTEEKNGGQQPDASNASEASQSSTVPVAPAAPEPPAASTSSDAPAAPEPPVAPEPPAASTNSEAAAASTTPPVAPVAPETPYVPGAPTMPVGGEQSYTGQAAYQPNQAQYGQPVQAPPAQDAYAQQPPAQYQANYGQPPVQGQPGYGQPYYAQPTAPVSGAGSGKALGALICGIAAIVTSELIIPGIILGIIAIVLASQYVKAFGKDAKAVGGKITGIVGIVLSVLTAIVIIGVIVLATISYDSPGYRSSLSYSTDDYDYDYDYDYDNAAEEETVVPDAAGDGVIDGESSGSLASGKRSDPIPLGESISFDFTYYGSDYTDEIEGNATLVIDDVIRGDEAYEMLAEANQFNKPAPKGQEWVLINAHFRLNVGSEDDPYYCGSNFKVFDSSGSEVSQAAYAVVDSQIDFGYVELYQGGKNDGYVALLVPEGDEALVAWNDFRNKIFFSLG